MKTMCLNHRLYFIVVFCVLIVQPSLRAEEWPFSLNCPKDVTVSCHDELWNLSIYGNATYYDGYRTYSAGTPTVKYFLNSCNSGYITRTWMVEDNMWQWHTCTQTIYVSPGSASGPYISWPKDIELTGCNPNTNPNQLPAGYDYPIWDNTSCAMFGKSYSDMLFTVNNQCKKIMRTWKVMDWCKTTSTYSSTLYTHVQFIYIINNTPPVVNCPGDITIESYNCKNAYLTANPLIVAPGACNSTFEVTNNSIYAVSKGNNISGTYPIGTTKVSYTIKYGCGKTFYCHTNVVVQNASKPVPYCLGQLATALMGVDTDKDGKVDNGMVEIWAKDLDKGSHSLCGNAPLRFSFSPNVNEMSKVFTCDHVGNNEVAIWVTDSKGAQTFCLVDISIQNNGANIPNCKPKTVVPPPPPVIPPAHSKLNGSVFTITDLPLGKVDVKLEYKDPILSISSRFDTIQTLLLDSFINASGYKLYRYEQVLKITETKDTLRSYVQRVIKTSSDGRFKFDTTSLVNKTAYLSATYNDSIYNYIDFKDVLLLKKFIDKEIVFNSYHQYLASDIDENGIIEQEDYNLLADFVERKIPKLPGDHQWYLMDARTVFVKAEDVLQRLTGDIIRLDSINASTPDVNFVAIKKGNISINEGAYQNDALLESRTSHKGELYASVKPNPFYDNVMVTIRHPHDGEGILTLFDVNGKELHKNTLHIQNNAAEYSLDWSALPHGLMFYRIVLHDQITTGKLVHLK